MNFNARNYSEIQILIWETRITLGILISLWLLQIFVILWACDTQRQNVVPCFLWGIDAVRSESPADGGAATNQLYCGSKTVIVVFLQWVSFSAMMEDLGISLRCYQGIRKRSRPYCRAKSACVLCQPRCVPKRVEERRDSSTWAQRGTLWKMDRSFIRLDESVSSNQICLSHWMILHHQSPFSLYLILYVIL